MSGPGQRRSSPWRHLATIIGVLVFCGLIYVVVTIVFSEKSAPRKPPEIKIVAIVPPPPPPPPPPPEPPKMVEQEPVPEEKPKEMIKEDMKQDEPPPSPLEVDSKGDGPGDNFGLKSGSGRFLGGGGGGGKYVPYASMVQAQIAEVLRAHPKLKYAAYRIPADVWPDSTGRISRVELGSTGDKELDAAMRQALVGLVLREPPPKDMPMPINVRLTGRNTG